jgi:ATP-dependent Zn protease
VFFGRDLANMGNVAAKTLELVDSETRRMVREAEEIARSVIELNAGLLEDMANTLLGEETLSGVALEAFLENVKPWPTPLVEHSNGAGPVKLRESASAAADDIGGWPVSDR